MKKDARKTSRRIKEIVTRSEAIAVRCELRKMSTFVKNCGAI